MQVLSVSEVEQISGAGWASCNWHDFSQDTFKGAVGGGVAGAFGGAAVSVGALTIPGWAVGAGLGGLGGAAAYGLSCGW